MAVSDHDPRVLATLLLALHDRLNTIRAPRWQRENESGPTERRWRECQGCRGEGTVKRRKHRATCAVCHGRKGWKVDDYTQQEVVTNSRGAAELSLLEFWETAERYALDAGEPGLTRLERLIDRSLCGDLEDNARTTGRADHPSTIQLWDALSIMLRDFPHHGGILYRVYVWAWTPEEHLGDHDRELVDDALHILAETLKVRSPGFRAPAWALKAVEAEQRIEKARRDLERQHADRWPDKVKRAAEARRLAQQGRSVRWIAHHMGVSKSVVGRDLAA